MQPEKLYSFNALLMKLQQRSINLFSLIALLVGVCSLTVSTGCDTSENSDLLNPPLPDSTQVRVVNLVSNTPITVTMSTQVVASNVAPYNISTFTPVFFREPFPLYIEGSAIVDTVHNVDLNLVSGLTTLQTLFIVGTPEQRSMIRLLTSNANQAELERTNSGQLYFINAITGSNLTVRRGCRSGSVLFTALNGPQVSFETLGAGEYSLYLFESDSTEETATAHITVQSGQAQYLIAADMGNGPGLYLLDATAGTVGPIQAVQPESDVNAQIEFLNALDNLPITVSFLGSTTPIIQDLSTRTISPPSTLEVCREPNGDSLVIEPNGLDSALVPMNVSVSSKTLAMIYNDGFRVRLLSLDRAPTPEDPDKIYIRGVNLSPASESAAIVIGAGAPTGVPTDFRPFGALKVGQTSKYTALPQGTYPLTLQQSSTGKFFDGGLQNFTPGHYTLLILEENGAPVLYFIKDDLQGGSPQRLTSFGRNVLFFSMVPGQLVDFQATSGPLSLNVDSVAYSYVFPTVLPSGMATITSPGVGNINIDLSTSSFVVGATGTGGNQALVSFPSPNVELTSSQAGIRFLNAVPDAGPLDVHIVETQVGPVEATISFGIPSPSIVREARRYSFSITRAGTDDVVARIDGVELSGNRNYLLIIGPKGVTSSSQLSYGTLWMQE